MNFMKRKIIVGLSVPQIENVAHVLAGELMEYGEPIPAFNTRFPDRLESCLRTPFQKFSGKSLYRGVVGKGSILFYLMVKNHPFQNGNKRVAVMALLYFLYRNARWITVDNDTLYVFANTIAESDPVNSQREIAKIRAFIRKYIINRKGEPHTT